MCEWGMWGTQLLFTFLGPDKTSDNCTASCPGLLAYGIITVMCIVRVLGLSICSLHYKHLVFGYLMELKSLQVLAGWPCGILQSGVDQSIASAKLMTYVKIQFRCAPTELILPAFGFTGNQR